MYIIDDALLKA